jgi:hypothetical protein
MPGATGQGRRIYLFKIEKPHRAARWGFFSHWGLKKGCFLQQASRRAYFFEGSGRRRENMMNSLIDGNLKKV